MPEETTTEVNISIDEGLPTESGEAVTDVDDINQEGYVPENKEDKSVTLPKEEVVIDDRFKTMETRLNRLETDKKNLQIALHKERQLKKEVAKDVNPPLTREQLLNIMQENPDDETRLRVLEYMVEQKTKQAKDTAISEVDISQKSRAVNKLLLDRYPALADESSEMRIEIDQVKEVLGIRDNPFGDAFAVGVKVVESLPTLLANAYERGKKEALGTVAETKRSGKIADTKLTPKGSGKTSSVISELTADQEGTINQLNLTASQKKIYKQLVGKQPRSLSVEE